MTSDGGTDPAADDAAHDATDDAAGAEPGRGADGFDLKGMVRPADRADARLARLATARADRTARRRAVDPEDIDAALASRMATIDRAIADLSRAVDALERRLDAADERG